MPSLSFVLRDGLSIARIEFADTSKTVNVLNAKSIEELDACIAQIESQIRHGHEVHGLIIRSAMPDMFIAGADITEIQRINDAEEAEELVTQVNKLFLRIENLPMPVVALINGPCLGGGLELALACHYRIAVDSPKVKIGLPETQLGIIPGFGGTQRLPRLIGLQAAIKAITTARKYGADAAHRLGIVDRVVADEQELLDAGESWITEVTEGGRYRRTGSLRSQKTRLERMPFGPSIIRRKAKQIAHKKSRGHYPAIPAAIDAVIASTLSLDEGLALEAKAFGALAVSPVSKYLIGIYFLTQSLKKQSSGTPRSVASVGILGAGVMGSGIALTLIQAGIPVVLKDSYPETLPKAEERIEAYIAGRAQRGRWSQDRKDETLALVRYTSDDADLADVDVVIEAIVELLEKKQEARAAVLAINPDVLFVSNTSSLRIDEIGEGVVGMHFFNPAEKMPLVEVVRGKTSHEDDVATVIALALRIKKTPIVVADSPGFLVNRVLGAYFAEAGLMVAEGIPIDRIDKAALRFGMPMGPFRLLDEVGLDIAAHVAENLAEAYGDRMRVPLHIDLLVEGNVLGKKTDSGFWFPGGKSLNEDTLRLAGIISEDAKADYPTIDIQNRLFYAMLNELFSCVEDGVVLDRGLADLAMIFGTGFPPFTGGPFALADARWLANAIIWMDAHAGTNPRLIPSPALRTAMIEREVMRADLS